MSTVKRPPRLIAFHLPQYHPIPENDRWWGTGFTEWTNTAKAKPLFPDHYQPHVPADLGFYDLRLSESRLAQAELARTYGIEGFCYYEYWFGGKRLLERPFQEILDTGEPEFPFCICWANETWTGIWHGAPNRVLIEQTYPGLEDHRAHFVSWQRAFNDSRYIKVDGKPVLVIYRPEKLPDAKQVTQFWRRLALEGGFPGLYLIGVSHNLRWSPQADGFDATVTPNLPERARPWVPWTHPIKRLRRALEIRKGMPVVHNYADIYPSFMVPARPGVVDHPCLIPNWDNTPRSGKNGLVLHGSTPALFRAHVRQVFESVLDRPPEQNLVFVKSWNEWAEGNHLEPDLRFGCEYLESLRDELQRFSGDAELPSARREPGAAVAGAAN